MSLRPLSYAPSCVVLRLLSPNARPCHGVSGRRHLPVPLRKCFIQVRLVYSPVQLEIFQLPSPSALGYDESTANPYCVSRHR
jgi:hypothetical protein